MAKKARRRRCISLYKFPGLYVSIQLAKSPPDERACSFNRFRQLPIISPLEISGNSGVVQVEALGGLFEGGSIQEFADGLPLPCGDLQKQRIVEPVDQIDCPVEFFIAGHKGGQNFKFEEMAGLDTLDGLAGKLKSFAAKAVYGRLDAAGNAAETHADTERKRPECNAEIINDGGYRRQVARNSLKFIP